MKKIKVTVSLLALIFGFSALHAQSHTDQNGLKSSVINYISANNTQAMRYQIATIGYNSYHWQTGGLVMIELFNLFYATGYERYVVNNGFGTGINSGNPQVLLLESGGTEHHAKISLGSAYNLQSTYAGQINRALPVYADVNEYSKYVVRITYLQNRVEEVTDFNQIKVDLAPVGQPIAGFVVPTMINAPLTSTQNLMVSGEGVHYISNGNVGIGTTMPDAKLTVLGDIHAKEVKVNLNVPGPDYVFEKDYPLPDLNEVKEFIAENQHLPDIPSAAEMEKYGLKLGELNMKLLKKIEELTLYVIDLKKESERQNELNKLQAVEIENLKNLVGKNKK
ncbi:hypothetical protein GS399_05240 [Pedobacter sp. HMF7647]|uniref:Uncharacterized protein n=1 Tax=Hufsiella arboris TaxID=2695275 RepID=A0A7K1Y8G2_9SPHI|nr:hypothetical protein [Hufsiella arboris]MXV50369.1 hypothetical protein [Hufsiella arboris]